MPNWTDDEGRSWFNKLECKRCLGSYEAINGEIPKHQCIGGFYKSHTFTTKDGHVEYHQPVKVS